MIDRAAMSPVERLAALPKEERDRIIASLPEPQLSALRYDWRFHARPKQLAPEGDWRIWLMLAGRGSGKTRSGGEWVRDEIESGRRKRIAVVGRTAKDVRDVMIASILAICPPWDRPVWHAQKNLLVWPNGGEAWGYSAEEPDSLRGPQHDGFWADELATWKTNPGDLDPIPPAWDQLLFTLRIGDAPRGVVTTTPRPIRIVRSLIADPTVVTVRASSYENRTNLAPEFFRQIISRYAGTRLGRQEIDAEILEDTPGALWRRDTLDRLRVADAPELVRVVVAVDPAASSADGAADTGIVVAGLAADGHAYVLEDASAHGTPREWAGAAIGAYTTRSADRIVAEANNGGEMVAFTIATVDGRVPTKLVYASRGKQTRAEPISALYERGVVHHAGSFPELEDQMCSWVPGERSPDRMDALVWALTELYLGEPDESTVVYDEPVSISPF